jgi:N-acetylmuramic acid 6-phosphate etherase
MTYHSKWQSLPTEAINTATLGIDKMPVSDIVDLMSQEDKKVVAAVHKERERIAHGVDLITASLRDGGRLFFVGAGTSGRLCIVEATDLRHAAEARAGDHGRRPGRGVLPAGGRRGSF